MFMINVNSVIGIIGLILVLVAFALNLFNKIKESSKTYLWLNIIGCALLFYYSIIIRSIPFAILQGVWALVALTKLISKK